MKQNSWVRLLTYITGLVNQELLLQNEYLAAENRILRAQLPVRLHLSDLERTTLAEIGKRLGRKALAQIACVAKPDTILAWYRKLIAQKFDGSRRRSYPGRPRIDPRLEALIIRMAQENGRWGYDRIAGALANLGYHVSDQTVARNATGESWGYLNQRRYALHDRDTKFCASFRATLASGGTTPIQLPARSPNLKGYASHCTSWVLCARTSFARRRWESFTPCVLRGGLSPGCSNRQSFLSL